MMIDSIFEINVVVLLLLRRRRLHQQHEYQLDQSIHDDPCLHHHHELDQLDYQNRNLYLHLRPDRHHTDEKYHQIDQYFVQSKMNQQIDE